MTPMQQFVGVAGVVRRAAAVPRTLSGAAAREARNALSGVASWVFHELGEHVDLTPLVTQVVDLDGLIATVDVDAVLDRVDLVALVETVLAEIDLPEIIRSSTGSMASETLTGVRLQGISADEAVARVAHRLLLRGHRANGNAAATVQP